MRVTNEQLKSAMDSIDKRVTNIESILMSKPNGNSKVLSQTTTFLVKWVIFPLIVVIGAVIGVSINLPTIGGQYEDYTR